MFPWIWCIFHMKSGHIICNEKWTVFHSLGFLCSTVFLNHNVALFFANWKAIPPTLLIPILFLSLCYRCFDSRILVNFSPRGFIFNKHTDIFEKANSHWKLWRAFLSWLSHLPQLKEAQHCHSCSEPGRSYRPTTRPQRGNRIVTHRESAMLTMQGRAEAQVWTPLRLSSIMKADRGRREGCVLLAP